MADQNAKFDPLVEVRQRYPGLMTWSDETILQHLNDPNKFRSAFPEYSHLNDATIRHNMRQLSSSVQESTPGTPLRPDLPSRPLAESRSSISKINKGPATQSTQQYQIASQQPLQLVPRYHPPPGGTDSARRTTTSQRDLNLQKQNQS